MNAEYVLVGWFTLGTSLGTKRVFKMIGLECKLVRIGDMEDGNCRTEQNNSTVVALLVYAPY